MTGLYEQPSSSENYFFQSRTVTDNTKINRNVFATFHFFPSLESFLPEI